MASEDYKMPKLNGDNYHTWCIRSRAILVQKRCWEAVEPGYGNNMNEAERKKNDEALTLLFLIVEDTFLDDIGECIRARDAWNSLKEMHTKFGLLHVLQLMREFFNIVMKPNESVQAYLARLMDLHRKLSNGGYAFTDREVALVMLLGLPKAYESLILNFEKDEANLTTTFVKSRLLVEEKRIARNESLSKECHEEQALHTKSFTYNQKKPAAEKPIKKYMPRKHNEEEINRRKNIKCFCCGRWGHISRNCEEAKQQKQNTAKTAVDVKTNIALLADEDESRARNLWILDSGATEHMTSDRRKFSNLRHHASEVEVANSERINVSGVGDISFPIYEENEERNITIQNVLYVPKLGGNLLSIGRIEEKGLKVEFADGKAKVIDNNGKTLLSARKKGRLYIIEEQIATACMTRTESVELMHRRLGHPHYNTVKNLNSIDEDKKLPALANAPCSICIQGKMKRKKFPKSASTRAKDLLEIIHSDVVGKISPSSLGGSSYFVTFTDDFSNYTTLYTMKTKSEVLEKFDEYRRMVETLHNKKIKILRSDNGGEFRSVNFDKYLTMHGIRRQLSVPETPQQNGKSERLNQSLINTTRCLLIESGAEHRFWAEATATAAYLHNKRPSCAINGNIPEEIWTSSESKTEHLKVFGCRAWSHVRSISRKSKLDPKAVECIFVGYPNGVKGYKLYDLKKKQFFVSRDVIFEEDIFPLKTDKCHNTTEEITLSIENFENEDYLYTPEVEVEGPLLEQSNTDTDDLSPEECSNQQFENIPNEDSDISIKEITEVPNTHDTETEVETSNPTCGNKRGKTARPVNPPKHLEDYYLYNAQEIHQYDEKNPVTVKEALKSPEADMWKKAMNEEISNLTQAETWELTTKPPGVKIIPSRWLFCKKKDETGNRAKFKARLVAKGYLQVSGVDFQDTFAPVIKLKSIRLLLAIAAEKDFEIHQMDITAAYLNGVLEEDLYMAQPEGCIEEGKEHLVCHLKKSIYGLRQSGRVWNTCLNDFLINYGLARANADPCIYFCHRRNIIIGVYVDDLLIIGDMPEINKFKEKIKEKFIAKDLGPASQILSMQICKEDGSYTLDQTAYVSEILETFKMTEARPAATPLDPSIKYNKVDDQQWEESERIPYRQAIGSILYLTCGTRPDMAYSSTYMSQFNEKHTEEHWRGVKHILRYLKGTRHRKLKFRKTGEPLKIYSDADWGGDRTDRKSYSGYIMLLAGAPISWSSKKQSSTALSSTEAEYIAMCHTAKETLWINNLLKEVCSELMSSPQKVLVDNQGAMFMAKNHVTSERSKHIDIKYFFLRDLVKEKTIIFEYIPSSENLADLLTKQVSKKTLQSLEYAATYLGK